MIYICFIEPVVPYVIYFQSFIIISVLFAFTCDIYFYNLVHGFHYAEHHHDNDQ